MISFQIYQIENQIAEFMKTNPNALAKIAQKEQLLANQQGFCIINYYFT